MTVEPEITAVVGPRILHEGRYRLYEKPDGGLRIQYKRDDSDTEDFIELPGAMVRLAKMASEGNMSFPQFIKEAAKLRNEHLCIPRAAWTANGHTRPNGI
jgi:hypothetical protein